MGKVLLVVDDSSTIRTAVELIFEGTEYRVVSKENGNAGLAWMRSHTPDLILVDERMPDMDGYDFGSKVKAASKNEDVPILLLACHDGPDESRADDADLDGYVNKPFGSQELVTLVEMLTGSSQISQMPLSFKEQLVQRQRQRKERLDRGEAVEELPIDEQLSLEEALAELSDEPRPSRADKADEVVIPTIDQEKPIAPVRIEARAGSVVRTSIPEIKAPELRVPMERAPSLIPPIPSITTPSPITKTPSPITKTPSPISAAQAPTPKPMLVMPDPDLTPMPDLEELPRRPAFNRPIDSDDFGPTPMPEVEAVLPIHADLQPPPRFPPPTFASPRVERANMIETLPPLRRDVSAPRRPMPSPPQPLPKIPSSPALSTLGGGSVSRRPPPPPEPTFKIEAPIPMEPAIHIEPVEAPSRRAVAEMMVNIEAPIEAPPPPSLPPPLAPLPPPPKMEFDAPKQLQPRERWNEDSKEAAATLPPRVQRSSRGLLFALLALAVVGALVGFYLVS